MEFQISIDQLLKSPTASRLFNCKNQILPIVLTFLISTDIFNCKTQVQSKALTFFEVQLSANSIFLICNYTFTPMCKCRYRLVIIPMKISPAFSLQNKILAICTYVFEKKVITKTKIHKCTYLFSKNNNGKTSNQ